MANAIVSAPETPQTTRMIPASCAVKEERSLMSSLIAEYPCPSMTPRASQPRVNRTCAAIAPHASRARISADVPRVIVLRCAASAAWSSRSRDPIRSSTLILGRTRGPRSAVPIGAALRARGQSGTGTSSAAWGHGAVVTS
jgi:hypothetical protein